MLLLSLLSVIILIWSMMFPSPRNETSRNRKFSVNRKLFTTIISDTVKLAKATLEQFPNLTSNEIPADTILIYDENTNQYPSEVYKAYITVSLPRNRIKDSPLDAIHQNHIDIILSGRQWSILCIDCEESHDDIIVTNTVIQSLKTIVKQVEKDKKRIISST